MSIASLVKFAAKSFTLPDTCIQLRQAIDDPKASLDDLAEIISVDPSLSGKVLRLANSSLFNFPSTVDSVSRALSIIGGEAAYNISIAETANVAFKQFDSTSLNFEDVWYRAVFFGVAAKSLAQQAKLLGCERFFALGILQSISELIIALKLEDTYAEYHAETKIALDYTRQSKYFGFTFSECSGFICESWGLPMSLTEPLKQQTHPLQSKLDSDGSVLYLAMTLHSAMSNNCELDKFPDINHKAATLLNLGKDDFKLVSNFAHDEAEKIAKAIA